MIENWAVKCDHIPSRVPGLPHTLRSSRASAPTLIRTGPADRYGESFTSTATATISSRGDATATTAPRTGSVRRSARPTAIPAPGSGFVPAVHSRFCPRGA